MLRDNQEKMLQTLMFIQQMQMKSVNEDSDHETDTCSREVQEVQDSKAEIPSVSSKTSGIASQLFEQLLKNESSNEGEKERRDSFDTEEDIVEVKEVSGQRKRREIFKCPHTDRKHYAKNMCHNCYHRKGKTKMAYACGHTNKSHYSSGMCQNCYLAKYYIKRKNKMEEKAKAEASKKDSSLSLTAESKDVQETPSKKQRVEWAPWTQVNPFILKCWSEIDTKHYKPLYNYTMSY